MWRRQEDPKVSPSPQNVVVTPPPPPVAQPRAPQVVEPVVPKAASSLISKGISIHGQISGGEDIQVDGEVHGSLKLAGSRVMIGPDGRVAGDIEAREIVVRGTLKGNLLASERILVGSTGRWKGDSTSPRLVIEEGAVVSGNLEVAPQVEKKTERSKPANSPAASTSASSGNGSKTNGSASGTNGSSSGHDHHEHAVTAVASGTEDIV